MKGQIWSLDFIASAVIFTAAVVLVIFAWSFTSAQTGGQARLADMESIALELSDSLIRTGGVPDDWNSTTVQSLGLASEESILSRTKVNRFINLSYTQARGLMGIETYEFYFELLDMNGSLMTNQYGQNLTAGDYPSGAGFSVPVRRFVLLEGEAAKMRFILWV